MKSDPILKFITNFFEGSMALLLLFTAFTVTAAAQKPRGGAPKSPSP